MITKRQLRCTGTDWACGIKNSRRGICSRKFSVSSKRNTDRENFRFPSVMFFVLHRTGFPRSAANKKRQAIRLRCLLNVFSVNEILSDNNNNNTEPKVISFTKIRRTRAERDCKKTFDSRSNFVMFEKNPSSSRYAGIKRLFLKCTLSSSSVKIINGAPSL